MISAQPARTLASFVVVGLLAVSAASSPAAAQTDQAFRVSGEFTTLHLSEFDVTTSGLGARAAWRLLPALAIDGAFSWFPRNWQTGGNAANVILSNQSKIMALGGVTSGVAVGNVELFGRARAGVLDFMREDAPFACLTIFPATLDCQLASGYTAFAFDFGGGATVALDQDGRLRLRLEAGDLMVRYGLDAIRPGGVITTGFYGHNLLLSASVGWRF